MAVTDIKPTDTEAQKKAKRALNFSRAKKDQKNVREGKQTDAQKNIVSVGKEVLPFLIPVGLLAGAAVKLGRVAFQSKYGKKAWNAITKGIKNFERRSREPEFRTKVMKNDRFIDPATGKIMSNEAGKAGIRNNRFVKATLKQVAGGEAMYQGLSKAGEEVEKIAEKNRSKEKTNTSTVSPNQKSRQADLSVVQKVTQKKDLGDMAKKNKKTQDSEASVVLSSIGKDAESKRKTPPKPRPKPKAPRPRDKDVEGMASTEKKIASKKAAQDMATQEKRSRKKPTTTDVGEQVSKKKTAKKKDISDPKKAKGYDYSPNEDDYKFEADDLNLYKGGMAKAFGKGGMYKGNKKAYGMRYGGFTRRGMGK
jgi:hypothetical protein|tara:strand:- start:3648 stop:4742 length:1095 start_codon:yes stop_codon:yes gene_type:complete